MRQRTRARLKVYSVLCICRDQPELVLLSPEVMAKRLRDLKNALGISDETAAELLLKYTWLPLINIEVVILPALHCKYAFWNLPFMQYC